MLMSMVALASTHRWLLSHLRIVRGGTRALPLLPLLLSITLSACQEKTAEAPRARGNVGLVLRSAGQAIAIALIEVEQVARIDRNGYRARARVEHALSGPFAPGARIEIAWEELAMARSPRFRRGERVLVALAPLPTTTLWFNRFPPQLRTSHTLAVAASGEAFAEPLEREDLEGLTSYARLSATELQSLAAARALARLLRARNEQLALAALELIAGDWSRPYWQDAVWVESCREALLSTSTQVEVRKALIRWVAETGNPALTSALEELTQRDPALAPEAYLALEELGRPIPSFLFDQWISSGDVEVRLAAVRTQCGEERTDKLRALARNDPAPRVRTAALERLRECEGEKALPILVPSLADPDPGVRLAAAAQLSAVGPKASPAIESFALAGRGEGPLAAVAALEGMGAAGRPSLERIAREHRDPAVRTLAELALGKPRREHGHAD